MSHRITFRTILRTGPAALVLLVAAPAALAQDRITALDAQALDSFGFDVACHGELTLVGSWRDDDAGESTGSAHLVHTPGTSPPAYIEKLTLGGMAAGDLAGMHVAIGDGVLAISAPGRVRQRPGTARWSAPTTTTTAA